MNNAMKMLQNLPLILIFCLYCLATLIQGSIQHHVRKPYIVYMGELPEDTTYAPEDHHHNLLAAAIGDHKLAKESRIHSYGKSFNGFVARLLPHEAENLKEKEKVVSVFPNKLNKLHTTSSWNFLGMPLKVNRRHSVESNIIVGMLDTGISINCPSFNDKGYGPPPRRWKGKCVTKSNFTGCNNKVIGAKYFLLEQEADPAIDNLSPVDTDGHGTHTASTAAGAAVMGASINGVGHGTARGGAPNARLAIYKVCWSNGCSDMDLLAGFDDAISDGVNIISVSLGGSPREFFSDPMAIGAFHAMKRGILTSCSAGNSGPNPLTIENVAPWILTVAASSIDRKFMTQLALGDGKKVVGVSINTFSPEKKMYPLISGAIAGNADSYGNASACEYGTLSKEMVKGKIVYCLGETGGQDLTLEELEAAGTIVGVAQKPDFSPTTVIAGSYVDAYSVGKAIDLYINSTQNPQAVIYKTTSRRGLAPFIASFSSRGPETITSKILKPDLAAPGVDILAGYSNLPTLTGNPEDGRHEVFNILSGTSMACPHAAGAAAYVKSFHPEWSPTAIKSALMTTATPMRVKDITAELGSGSGQINPVGALNPGLIYDIPLNSYIAFLCKEGYNSTSIGILIGSKGFDCSSISPAQGNDGINYPSMYAQVPSNSGISATFYRTVTNVGIATSIYKANVIAPKGLSIKVVPDTLKFGGLKQELGFKVVVEGPPMPKGTNILSASLEWNDSKHIVRSPIVVYK